MAFTLQIGQSAPDFNLLSVNGKHYCLEDFSRADVLVVFFTCNHCPAVAGSQQRVLALHDEFHPRGVDWVGINSNDDGKHPEDGAEQMPAYAAEHGIRYPYLRDNSQAVATAYGALLTPHFFVFDRRRRLCYTGRLDNNPYDGARATTHELRDAIEAVLAGRRPEVELTNPIGCNVKWKGHDEHWMPEEACDLVLESR